MVTVINCGEKVVLGFFGLIIMSTLLYAAPVITKEPSGLFEYGQAVYIQGTGFGINSAVGTTNLQSIGENIEKSANGNVFDAPGWGVYQEQEDNEVAVPRYSRDLAHSGSQSIKIDYIHNGALNRYKGHFYYDHGGMINRVYVSFWLCAQRMQNSGDYAKGQWKIWRIKENSSFTDGSLDFIQNSFHPNSAGGAKIATLFTVRYNSSWDCKGCANEPSTKEVYLGSNEVPGPNAIMYRWVRMEYWIDVGSLDNYDGTFVYKLHDPNNPSGAVIVDVPQLTFEGNLNILKTGENEDWKVLLFGGAAVDGLDFLVYWDDVFIQIGSWARVEIGDAAAWGDCTHREVQVPTSWTDTSISFNFQQGSFAPGNQVYVFVVDDNGVPSAGKGPIVIGESIGGSAPVPPAKINDFRNDN